MYYSFARYDCISGRSENISTLGVIVFSLPLAAKKKRSRQRSSKKGLRRAEAAENAENNTGRGAIGSISRFLVKPHA